MDSNPQPADCKCDRPADSGLPTLQELRHRPRAALAGGRLTVLVIIGSMDREFSEFGLDPDLKARGRALDERLARLQELWRQWGAPEIPLWCGGRWRRKPGLRRAARFDGVLLTFADQRNSTVPVETFADAVGFVRGLAGNRPFGIAVEAPPSRGQLPGTSPRTPRPAQPGGSRRWAGGAATSPLPAIGSVQARRPEEIRYPVAGHASDDPQARDYGLTRPR